MRAVIYSRVSSDAQVDNFSLDAQERLCRGLIEQRGYEFVGTYREEGESAKNTDRPAFQRLLRDAECGRLDIVVVHKYDRFARNTLDLLRTLEMLEARGATLTSVAEPFDVSTPHGRFQLTTSAALAQWQNENLAAETRKGKRERAMRGYHSSRVPFGYSVNKETGIAEPDENAAGVELAASLAESGDYSFREIAARLNEAGYRPTGRAGKRSIKLWSPDTVRWMLKNRFYIGEVEYRGEFFEGRHQPLMTEERWRHLQAVMSARGEGMAFRQRKGSKFYLLSGLVRCVACGEPMRGTYRVDAYKGRKTVYRYYRCASSFRGYRCAANSYISAELVEGAVLDFIKPLTIYDEWKARLEALRRESAAAPARDSAASIARTQRELERLRDLYRLGDIDRAEYLSERDRLRAELRALEPPPAPPEIENIRALAESVGAMWEIATNEQRKKLVAELVERVDVRPGKEIDVIPRAQYAFLFA